MSTRPANPENLNYTRMHDWLRRHQGRASDYPCAECGDTEHKHSWSFNHEYTGDVREGETHLKGETYTAKWSPDPEAYQPLCNRCHNKRDGFDGRSGKGKKKSPEHVAKIAAAIRGPRPHLRGRKQSEDHKTKRIQAVTHTRWHVGRGILDPDCSRCVGED
jgi:hypothetical protein